MKFNIEFLNIKFLSQPIKIVEQNMILASNDNSILDVDKEWAFHFSLNINKNLVYKVTHFEITPHLIQVYVCETLYRVAVNLIVLLGQARTTH